MDTVRLVSACAAVVVVAGTASAAYIDHDFDTGFTGGGTALNGQQDWAGDATAVVTNDPVVGQTDDAVCLPSDTAISNNIAAIAPTNTWTEFRIRPQWGVAPDNVSTSGTSFTMYFTEEGYLSVWNGGSWHVCSNDVWGGSVPSLTGTATWVEVAIYQNFSSQKAVLFLNDKTVLQDLPFPDTMANYGHFLTENVDGPAYIEDVRVQTTYDTARLGGANYNSRNGDDAAEVDTHGYVGRTIDVGPGRTYTTLAAALEVYRYPLDELYVYTDAYAETITLTQNVVFAGQSFSSTAFTIAAGYTATFNNDVTLTTLTGNGNITLASGVALDATTVDLNGASTLTLNSGAAVDCTALAMEANTTVDVTTAAFAASGAGVDMAGTFTIDGSDWGADAVVDDLPFSEDWELYAANSQVQNLAFRGWGASDPSVIVQSGEVYAGSKAVILPDGTALSNRISTAEKQIWTDYWIKPMLGAAPSDAATNVSAFMCYGGINGHLYVSDGSGWIECAQNIVGAASPTMSTSSFSRVTVHLDFDTGKYAVFLDGRLLKEQQDFPGSASSYANFLAENADNQACLDEILISTAIPPGMTEDLDGDTKSDAWEIHNYGTLARYPPAGTLFKFM